MLSDPWMISLESFGFSCVNVGMLTCSMEHFIAPVLSSYLSNYMIDFDSFFCSLGRGRVYRILTTGYYMVMPITGGTRVAWANKKTSGQSFPLVYISL